MRESFIVSELMNRFVRLRLKKCLQSTIEVEMAIETFHLEAIVIVWKPGLMYPATTAVVAFVCQSHNYMLTVKCTIKNIDQQMRKKWLARTLRPLVEKRSDARNDRIENERRKKQLMAL